MGRKGKEERGELGVASTMSIDADLQLASSDGGGE